MKTLKVAFLLAGVLFIGWTLTNSIDRGIAQQDKMLCSSAQKSGNADYLKKCACYYAGGDISCIQNAQK